MRGHINLRQRSLDHESELVALVTPVGVESALSIHLENFATSLGSREQLAIAEFAQSMLVIPKQLSVTAAQDASDAELAARADLVIVHPSQNFPYC